MKCQISILFSLAFAAVSVLEATPQASASTKPNILFIMTDDQAAWTTGYSGNASAMTPALDSFRKESVSLPNTFVNSPVCSPSRATLMTSRYPTELGILEYGHARSIPNLRRGLDSFKKTAITLA